MENEEYRHRQINPGDREGQQTERGVQALQSLVEQHQKQLQLPDAVSYYDMWVDLLSETRGYVPQSTTEVIQNVSLGLGFLAYNTWGEMGYKGESKQFVFKRRLQREQDDYHGHLVLPYEQGKLLQQAASAIDIAYDPGTPEEVEKRTFSFPDILSPRPVTGTIIESREDKR